MVSQTKLKIIKEASGVLAEVHGFWEARAAVHNIFQLSPSRVFDGVCKEVERFLKNITRFLVLSYRCIEEIIRLCSEIKSTSYGSQ